MSPASTALSNASSVWLNACRFWFSATITREAELLQRIAHGAGVVDRLLQLGHVLVVVVADHQRDARQPGMRWRGERPRCKPQGSSTTIRPLASLQPRSSSEIPQRALASSGSLTALANSPGAHARLSGRAQPMLYPI